MKKTIYILTILLLTSCFAKRYYIDVPYKTDRIFNSYPFEWFSCTDCQNNYESDISWYIDNNRITGIPFNSEEYVDSDFLLRVHNTLNVIGYNKLISTDFYEKNISGFIDSLILYETQEIDSVNYYSMFLHRREIQGTKEVVMEIIRDIKNIYNGVKVITNNHLINDTIVMLVNLDYKLKLNDGTNKRETLIEIYDYLISIKQYHLAYQIMNRPIDFELFGFSKDSAILTFPIDTVKELRYSDTTIRLGNFDKKGKWTDSYLWWKDYPGP